MKLNSFIIIGFLTVGFFASGCEKLQNKKEYKLKSEFKEYFKFGELSVWNYKNQHSANVALSHELLKFQEGIMDLGEAKQEFFEYELKAIGGKNILFRAISDLDNVNRLSLFVLDSSYRTAAEVYFVEGQFKAYYGDDDKILSHPNYTIDGQQYTNVFELQLGKSNYFSKIFFAKNIGIIELDDKQGNQFFLKNYSLK